MHTAAVRSREILHGLHDGFRSGPGSGTVSEGGFYLVQAPTDLLSASAQFLAASELSIIFGVPRVANFAHGSFYMVGAYVAYTFVEHLSERPPSRPSGVPRRLPLRPSLVTLCDAASETLSMGIGQRNSLSTVAQLALVPTTTRTDFARLIPT